MPLLFTLLSSSIPKSPCFRLGTSEWISSLCFQAFWSATYWSMNTKNTGNSHCRNFMHGEFDDCYQRWARWFSLFRSFWYFFKTQPNESDLFLQQDRPSCTLLTGISSLNLQIIFRQKQKPIHLVTSGLFQLKSSFTCSSPSSWRLLISSLNDSANVS
ncbi:unannotated protein [freshwater metagenome]|uniref:Unannotated protein n=1 Tax=freshwater metagenome TaxID=449393 RepID=A0A6J7LD66_9ZZZZ